MDREYWPQPRLRAELVTLYQGLELIDHAAEVEAARRAQAEDTYRSVVDQVIARQRELAVARAAAARERLAQDAERRRARPLQEAARAAAAAARVAAIDDLLMTIATCQEQVSRSATELVAQAAAEQPDRRLSDIERDEAIRWVGALLDGLPASVFPVDTTPQQPPRS